jgi:glycosyltransferase involved in cell wall biosynthesis
MGTSSNFPHLDEVAPAMRQLLDERPGLVFRIVSNAPYQPLMDHPGVEQIPWSEETELTSLRGFDIGLMPLEDTDVARGKCGFKMIQYMSVGTPVVSSAVGANIEILTGTGAGELVAPAGDWISPLRELASNPARRHAMGIAGRRRVVHAYSVQSVLDRYVALFASVARDGRVGGA